jgi:hypothetical protein
MGRNPYGRSARIYHWTFWKSFSALKEAVRVPLPKLDAGNVKDAAVKTAEASVGGGEGEDQPRSTT